MAIGRQTVAYNRWLINGYQTGPSKAAVWKPVARNKLVFQVQESVSKIIMKQ